MKTKVLLAILAAGALGCSLHAQSVDTVVATNFLNEPMGVVANGDDVYITSSVNNNIVHFNTGTSAHSILAGNVDGAGGNVNSPVGVLARFASPQGIIMARGGLVVSDSGNHILRLVTFSGAVTTLAGSGQGTSLVTAPAATAQFNNPVGMDVDADGNIYIADAGNNAIRVLLTNDTVITLATGFFQPFAVAVGTNGQVWVADTRHHVIQLLQTTNAGGVISLTGAASIAAGDVNFSSGASDAAIGTQGFLNGPRGLLWVGGGTGLLVADTGNHVVRRIYANPTGPGYSISLVAGAFNTTGLVNGSPTAARFNSPVSFCRDLINNGFFIVDRGNRAIRRLQTSPPLPQIKTPRIGYVRMEAGLSGTYAVLREVTQITLNNDEIIAVDAEAGTMTYFTSGTTPSDPLDTSSILDPGPGVGSTAPGFVSGQASLPSSMVSPAPDFIIKARSSAVGRQASTMAQARFIFQVGAPSFDGDNAASFEINCVTEGARIFYTTNGLDPVDLEIPGVNFRKPSTTTKIQLGPIAGTVTVKVRGFRDNYKPSEISSKDFTPGKYEANKITFGAESGEGYSAFCAAPGQTFSAPIIISLLNGQKIYDLSLKMAVTNVAGNAPVQASSLEFIPRIYNKIATTNGTVYIPIEPNVQTRDNSSLYNSWLAYAIVSNLYDVVAQDLVSWSGAYNVMHPSSAGKVLLGEFHFTVPTNAPLNAVYQIRLERASASSDGVMDDLFIDMPTNDTVTAVRNIAMVEKGFVVGDCMPLGWFNAGDFGDTNILANDLLQIFIEAVLGGTNSSVNTDFLDSMDSCCVSSNGTDLSASLMSVWTNGMDATINTIAFGNNKLEVNDLFVTHRRMLDSNLVWYARYWPTSTANGATIGKKHYMVVRNQFRGNPNAATAKPQYSLNTDGPTPAVTVTAGDVPRGTAGQVVEVPISAQVQGDQPLAMFWIGLEVQPLDGSPALTSPVTFIPASTLGAPTYFTNNLLRCGACWLSPAAPITGSGSIGTLRITLPAGATTYSAYRVAITRFSGSPNGLGIFSQTLQDGLITMGDRSGSSLNDGIPDSWRLRYFNTVCSNELTKATGDADGDGVPNWAEYRAGTNPNDPISKLRLAADKSLKLTWPSISGKRYVIEYTENLGGTNWTAVGTNVVGDGAMKAFQPEAVGEGPRFYRVRLME